MDKSTIELLLDAVVAGEVTLPEARQMARAPETVASLTTPLAVRLSHALLRESFGDGWRAVMDLHLILRLAIDAASERGLDAAAKAEANLDWLEIARVALWHMPDPALYWGARRLGERDFQTARSGGAPAVVAALGFRLGTLHLDPWFSQRSRDDYDNAYRRWLEHYTYREHEPWPGTAEGPLPTPIEAASLANTYLAAAADHALGGERGRCLKALLQARDWEAKLKQKPSPADRDMANEALALLCEDGQVQPVVGLITDRMLAGHPFEQSEVKRATESFAIKANAQPSPTALDALIRLYALRSEGDPEDSTKQLLMLADATRAVGHEALTVSRFHALVGAIVRIAERSGDAVKLSAQHQLAEQSPVPVRVDIEAPETWRTFALALTLCEQTRAPCREDEAARVMEEWLGVGLLDERWREVGRYLAGSYWLGAGVNAYESQQAIPAVDAYARAVPHLASAGVTGAAMDCLERVEDVATRDGRASLVAIKLLSPAAADVRARLGGPARDVMRAIASIAVRNMSASDSKDPVLTGMVSQLAK